MAVRRKRLVPLIWLAVASLLGLGGAGCGKSSDDPPAQTRATDTETKDETPSPAGKPTEETTSKKPVHGDRLHRSFLEATRKLPPPDQRPPDRTMTGKSIGKLYGEVVRVWDSIRFTAADGTRIAYTATLETELGNIEIALDADLAPNHVRNFLALAKVGYYDGLVFDRIDEGAIPAEEDGKTIRYEGLQAGCPLGEGDLLQNSIGYWLNPEFDPDAHHEEGTVGFCHGRERDTAACKFYISLCKAPYLDGNFTVFGKVTHGLDVARKIFMRPTIIEEDDAGSHRPEKPVVIRKVTIHSKP